MEDRGRGQRSGSLVSARCPDCGATVYSPQLDREELLRRHRPYCPVTGGEAPSGDGHRPGTED